MKQSELLQSVSQLTGSQKERLERWIKDKVCLNERLNSTKPDVCPCCHQKTDMIKKGKLHKKQRYLCKQCGHKFVYDKGTVTAHMHISIDDFIEICLDTICLIPIKKTAARLNLDPNTVFNNRHKFLCLLEEILKKEDILLDGSVEIDETYELESTKGKDPVIRKARHRGEPSKYRGISHEQVCIVTTTDRNGHEIFKAVGSAKPTTAIITDIFSKHIAEKSLIMADGEKAYDKLAAETNSSIKHLISHKAYNKVHHLNTVNAIHKFIQETLTFYRGIATKYMNRYLAMFVIHRRFMDMDENEMTELIIDMTKWFEYSVSLMSLKTDHLFRV